MASTRLPMRGMVNSKKSEPGKLEGELAGTERLLRVCLRRAISSSHASRWVGRISCSLLVTSAPMISSEDAARNFSTGA